MSLQERTANEQLLELRDRYVPRGVAVAPIAVTRAEGVWVEDADGRRYLDFVGGIGCQNTGHGHPDAVAAIHEQVDRYLHQCFMVGMYEPYVEVCRRLAELCGHTLAVIIADTFGRPWREGLVNVAVGLAGFEPIVSYLGETDPAGHVLQATILAVADELASAAEPVMGKLDRIPVVIIRGARWTAAEADSRPLLRDPARDLFR